MDDARRSEPFTRRTLRIAPDFRRSCWYVIFGSLLVIFFAQWTLPLRPNARPGNFIAVACGYALIAVAASYPLTWRLIVDELGVERRTLLGSDLWSWENFASGRIHRAGAHFVNPKKFWWRRKLGLAYLEDADKAALVRQISTYFPLPPAPELPERLTIKQGLRTQITFHETGIDRICKGSVTQWAWSDVRYVHIVRGDSLRRDFWLLLLALPDDEIELKYVAHQGGTSPTWRGASSELVGEFVLQHVPESKVCIATTSGPSGNLEYAQRAIVQARRSQRELMWCVCIFSSLMMGLLVWIAATEGIWRAAIMGAGFFVFVIPVYFMIFRMHSARVREWQDYADKLSAEPQTAAG